MNLTYLVGRHLLWTTQYLHEEGGRRGQHVSKHVMNGVQGSPDIVDACAVQSGRFSEVVNLHGTSCKAETDHVWTVICDHQRRSANLLALVSTYLGFPVSLGLSFAWSVVRLLCRSLAMSAYYVSPFRLSPKVFPFKSLFPFRYCETSMGMRIQ